MEGSRPQPWAPASLKRNAAANWLSLASGIGSRDHANIFRRGGPRRPAAGLNPPLTVRA
jgi:hypothetical protein